VGVCKWVVNIVLYFTIFHRLFVSVLASEELEKEAEDKGKKNPVIFT